MSDAVKPGLRLANDNPWYCLATLYGEQPARGANEWKWDEDLAAKKRMAWNRWIAGALSNEQRADLVGEGFPEPELVPLTPTEKSAFCSAFASRTGREKEALPDAAGIVDFAHIHFDVALVFNGFLCAGDADFRSATFSGYADFHSATFSGYASFHSATFSEGVSFDSATFSRHAHFGSVMFSRLAHFRSATFSGDANFGSATFRYADFGSATFSEGVSFGSATFLVYASFGSATFSGDADFGSATFSKSTNFINGEFNAGTIFAAAWFETGVPDFRGAKMYEATEWHGVSWPPSPEDKSAAQDQVYAYERLKQEMERLKKHEDEQSFFRKELRARRGLVPFGSGAWLLNYAYEALSDYGQSIGKPLLWLFGLFAFGIAIFAGTAVFHGMYMTLSSAAGLSFANIFSFLPIKRETMTSEMITCLSSVAQIR